MCQLYGLIANPCCSASPGWHIQMFWQLCWRTVVTSQRMKLKKSERAKSELISTSAAPCTCVRRVSVLYTVPFCHVLVGASEKAAVRHRAHRADSAAWRLKRSRQEELAACVCAASTVKPEACVCVCTRPAPDPAPAPAMDGSTNTPTHTWAHVLNGKTAARRECVARAVCRQKGLQHNTHNYCTREKKGAFFWPASANAGRHANVEQWQLKRVNP